MKKILVINTGGTLTMEKTVRGYVPMQGFLEKVSTCVPPSIKEFLPAFDYQEWDPLLDSSNITPSHWTMLANQIAASNQRYDGFVILHGTDTMAYTASALAFMLIGLNKPVILTGSQIPLQEKGSDAPSNWVAAIAAAQSALPEVAIVFNNKLLRGCRSTKINATGSGAFDTPRYPPLGLAQSASDRIDWSFARGNWLQPCRQSQFHLSPLDVSTVRILFWAPGQSARLLEDVAREPRCKALILCAYGTGNAPHQDQSFVSALDTLKRRGILVMVTSQCTFGRLTGSVYEAGLALGQAGVIHGRGITTEAAYAKLMVLANAFPRDEDLRYHSVRNLCGESDS